MTAEVAGLIPVVTLGWRLKMSLAQSGGQAGEMAERLGVSRQTISRWMGDEGKAPRRAFLAQWALYTGVPLEWIETGEVPDAPDDGGADDETRTRNILLGRQNVRPLSYIREAA